MSGAGLGPVLVLATHNPGKLAEFARLLAPHGIELRASGALGLPAPEEDAPDFAGNARIKAVAAARASGLPALADDSGFCVASLGGAPGVHSARWAQAHGGHAAAMAHVRALAEPHPDRAASFVCALCLARPDRDELVEAEGRCDGVWVWPPRGEGGFGYDAMFVPEGETRTFAEMDRPAKAAIGHRGRAFAAFAGRAFGT